LPVAADAGRVFPRATLEKDTVAAARALIGARLVRIDSGGVRVARIVEVEAYLGGDLASHARTGRTPRNAAMFGPPGHAYVYLVYGMYECLNVVTETEGRPAAVLIRAVEPLDGEDLMRRARISWAQRREEMRAARQGRAPLPVGGEVASLPARRLARGPGLVCVAMSVGRELDGVDLCAPTSTLQLRSAPAGDPAPRLVSGPRVGIGYAPEPWRSMPLRFRALHGAAR
jgi:DNA-3-methyladenine glycosylase